MSPLFRSEIHIFLEIADILRRWADAAERHARQIGDRAIGPKWSDQDFTELHRTFLEVGRAFRDVARTKPEPTTNEPRPEVLAIRDGLEAITAIFERNAY